MKIGSKNIVYSYKQDNNAVMLMEHSLVAAMIICNPEEAHI